MRTFLFFGIMALVALTGLAYRNNWPPFNAFKTKEVLPQSEWNKVLIGKWKYKDIERNTEKNQTLSGDITFKQNNEFDMHVSVKHFDVLEYKYYGRDSFVAKSGGFLQGKWKILENGFVLYNILQCDIKPDWISNGKYSEKAFSDCSYFVEKEYGRSDGDLKADINSFNKKSILITGKRFSSEANISYSFEKVSD